MDVSSVQSESIASLAEALAAASAEMSAVPKSGYNRHGNYRYATDADISGSVRAPMARHGLTLVPASCSVEVVAVATKSGGSQNVATLTRLYRLVHSRGEWMNLEAIGVGMDVGDKAVAKAETSALKYLFKSLFALPTDGNADGDSDSPEAGFTASAGGRRQWQGRGQGSDDWPQRFERHREGAGVGQPDVGAHIREKYRVDRPEQLDPQARRELWQWVSQRAAAA